MRQLSVKTVDGISKFAIQSLMKMVTTVVDIVLVVGMVFVSSENLSVTTSKNCLSAFVFEKHLRLSIGTNSSGPVGENRQSLRFLYDVQRFPAHYWQYLL